MKLAEALKIIAGEPCGFRVQYEKTDGRIRAYSAFPSNAVRPPEPPLETKAEAWRLAELFAATAPACYENITVVGADFKPIDPERIFRRVDWCRGGRLQSSQHTA